MAWQHVLHVRELQLPGASKLVLYALASRVDRHGYCWPSVRCICADTGLQRRAIQIHLARLVADGLLVREQRAGQSNAFRLAFGMSLAGRLIVQRFDTAPTAKGSLDFAGDAEATTLGEASAEALFETPAEVRTSYTAPAHEVRLSAHDMHSSCARDAPEDYREDLLNYQKKAARKQAAVDNCSDEARESAWWRSKAAVMAQGIRLGLSPLPGEEYRAYKDRVFRAWQARRQGRAAPPKAGVRKA